MSEVTPRSPFHQRTHRLIARRFPTVGVFDDLTRDPDDLRAAFLLESITNDRMSLPMQRLARLSDDEIVTGPGTTLVMAAFLHADPAGGRFTNGDLGAWYASCATETAIAETVYHSDRRLRLSDGGFPASIQMRELLATVDAELIDLRGLQDTRPDLYDRVDVRAAQAFGVSLRWPKDGPGETGIVYDSVRRSGDTNVCIFRPSRVRLPVRQADHYEYRWDGQGDVSVFRLTRVTLTPGGSVRPDSRPSPRADQSVPEK